MATAISSANNHQTDVSNNSSLLRPLRSVYKRHHNLRFEWLRRAAANLRKNHIAVLELGCSDAKSLDFLPMNVSRYLGFDAGWRSGVKDGKPFGLEAARRKFQHKDQFEVRQSTNCEDLLNVADKFDLAIVMETFEYLPTAQLRTYISAICERLYDDGILITTMPNEKGLPVLIKAVGARLSGVPRSTYTPSELLHAALGKLEKVPRAERGRKGFDYRAIAKMVGSHLPEVCLDSIGFMELPCSLSLNIGMIASRNASRAARPNLR
ncbi:MAG TPA: class I SAM-dependent methyltransferase [Candidatus Acidoferrum sp.]|jgi:hypothetical protein